MGCCESVPPNPEEGDQVTFILTRGCGMAPGANYRVTTEYGEPWLRIRPETSSSIHEKAEYLLENYKREVNGTGEVLGRCEISPLEIAWLKHNEFEFDSDDSEYSQKNVPYGHEFDVILKWKAKRHAKFWDAQGKEFAKLTFKAKGKSEVRGDMNKKNLCIDSSNCQVQELVNKNFYKFYLQHKHIPVWVDKDMYGFSSHRTWQIDDLLNVEYMATCCSEQVVVDTRNKQGSPTNALLVAFALAFFFASCPHKKTYRKQGEGES